ncbi:tyrosine-type recombinase/integrase [Patescibacteria group bacterium]
MNILDLHGQFCQECLLIKNYSPRTIKWYQNSLKGFLKHFKFKLICIDEVTTERLRDYLYAKRINNHWCADTFLNNYKGIKSFLKWCVSHGYLNANPIEVIDKPKLAKKLPKRITSQEAIRVIECAFNMRTSYRFERYRNRALFGVMIYAGLRIKEVLDLKMGHVDMENRLIHVFEGKGGKDRIIPVASSLHRYLGEYLDDRERLGRKSEYFFLTLRGEGPFSYRGVTRVIEKVKKRTKINFSCHKLRHTFATLMLEGGCDLFSLQKMMGHSDIKTTTIYLSASVNMLQKQILKHPLG